MFGRRERRYAPDSEPSCLIAYTRMTKTARHSFRNKRPSSGWSRMIASRRSSGEDARWLRKIQRQWERFRECTGLGSSCWFSRRFCRAQWGWTRHLADGHGRDAAAALLLDSGVNLLGSLPVGAGEDQNDGLASHRHPRPSLSATAMWGPSASCWPCRGGRRRFSSSNAWAPPVNHIPKRYVAWAGYWAAWWALVQVSRSSIFFCFLFFFYFLFWCFEF
jgi:hypothetical protein